jgi:tetratricopeptide (TPR) repeat protein
LLGNGAGSFALAFERHRPAGFIDQPQWAHNDYLNTASDYGAVGLMLLMAAATGSVVARRRSERTGADPPPDWLEAAAIRGGFAIGMLSFAIQLGVDFHFKIPALAMAFAIVAALALGRPTFASDRMMRANSRGARLGWFLAGSVVALSLLPVLRFSRAEDLRYRAREAIDDYSVTRTDGSSHSLLQAEKDLQRATALSPGHGQAWADLAFAFQVRAFANPALVSELAEPAIRAAQRATAASSVVPEFWIRLGVALDMQARREEAEKAFGNALRLAPRNSHAWYYYAYHLSFDTDRGETALRAIANCLSLDPGNRAAEALRVKLNERSSSALTIP